MGTCRSSEDDGHRNVKETALETRDERDPSAEDVTKLAYEASKDTVSGMNFIQETWECKSAMNRKPSLLDYSRINYCNSCAAIYSVSFLLHGLSMMQSSSAW